MSASRAKAPGRRNEQPVGSFYAYDGQTCLGVVRDFVTKVEAVNLAGRSLGFFRTRSEALKAFGSGQ